MLARSREHIHPVVFPVSAGVIVLFVIYGALFSEDADRRLGATRDWITANLGWFMIGAIGLLLLFCLWLVIGRYASVKLGPDDAVPDYSYLTWFAMLFSAGMGIGLVFWGVAEPVFHFAGAPRVESNTAEAAREALLLSFHHWGLGAWAVYAVLGLSLAYFGYRHDLPMTVRSALYPLIGERMHGWAGNLVDTLAIFGTMFGVATSLGLGVAQINAGLNRVLGVGVSQGVQISLIAGITLVATISVVTGIDKGIRRLSELNITLAGLLLLFIALVGPTMLLLGAYVENIGNYVTNFVELLFWSGSYDNEQGAWLSGWTIFYWAWWVSWAPFVGTFIARISRGRTIREFILGVLLVPSAVSFLWFTVMGNSALEIELEGAGDIVGPTFEATEFAMFALLEQLPWTTLTSIVTIFVIVVFFVTSSDSASYVIDMIASGGSLNPPVGMRVFWAVSEGVVAAVLLAAGGLGALQAGAIATGLPFTVVLLVAMVGIMKGLRSEQPGMTLRDVVAAPLIEGSTDRREARRTAAARTQAAPGEPTDGEPRDDTLTPQ
ncbi:BCCT family transporter [Nitriliruptor alkaliphilus]|uniref:BCCT family transporter n=1 Tax=Nitriliruptor alkaliphilus TaxID=427918 RepID=UPI001FE1AF05|nr:BCCT family transporter [Nitriliruptor alkaliphilus]